MLNEAATKESKKLKLFIHLLESLELLQNMKQTT